MSKPSDSDRATAAAPSGPGASPSPPATAKKKGEQGTMIVLALLTAASALICYAVAGREGIERSLADDSNLLLMMAPRVGAAVLIGGFVQVLAPRDLVARWLGAHGGWRAFALATVAGIATPGGPMLSFPIVVALRTAGANAPALVAYITAWATLGFHRILMWELPLFGGKFAIVRFLVSLPAPFIAGWITRGLLVYLHRPR